MLSRLANAADRAVLSREIDEEYATLARRRSVLRLMQRAHIQPQDFVNRVADFREAALLVHPTGEAPACRDERDRIYLHCAVAAQVDYLITADLDLLEIGKIESIPILTPAAYLELVARG